MKIFPEDNIITDRFTGWTKGKDPDAAKISIFEHIRDIPYAIVPALRDPVAGPPGLLKLCKGACGPKHYLLALMFAKLGIAVRYSTHTFNWDDPAIAYPPGIRTLTKKMPITGHLACRALIGGKWVLIDATWDLPLRKAGFPVNEKWDGVSDTICAVTTIKETVHETLEDRVKYDTSIRSAFSAEEKKVYEEFVSKLNPWLEEIRKR